MSTDPNEHPATPEQPGDEGFAEGEEELGEDDPEKHVERRFSEGVDHQPPEPTP